MPVSRNRKGHGKKVSAFRTRVQQAADKQKKKMEDMIAQIRQKTIENMNKNKSEEE